MGRLDPAGVSPARFGLQPSVSSPELQEE